MTASEELQDFLKEKKIVLQAIPQAFVAKDGITRHRAVVVAQYEADIVEEK